MKNQLKWFTATMIITFAMALGAAAQAVETCKASQFMGSGGRCQTVGSGGRMSSDSSQIYGSGTRADEQIVGSGAATGAAPEDGGLIGSGTVVDPPRTGEGFSFWGWLESIL